MDPYHCLGIYKCHAHQHHMGLLCGRGGASLSTPFCVALQCSGQMTSLTASVEGGCQVPATEPEWDGVGWEREGRTLPS